MIEYMTHHSNGMQFTRCIVIIRMIITGEQERLEMLNPQMLDIELNDKNGNEERAKNLRRGL